MHRTLILFLSASIILLATTFAGMAFFGMGSEMAMKHGTCIGSACDSMPGGMAGMECVNHCLSTLPVSSPVPLLSLAIVALVLLVFFLREQLPEVGSVELVRHRWRSGIGKILLHQNLSTIVLRH